MIASRMTDRARTQKVRWPLQAYQATFGEAVAGFTIAFTRPCRRQRARAQTTIAASAMMKSPQIDSLSEGEALPSAKQASPTSTIGGRATIISSKALIGGRCSLGTAPSLSEVFKALVNQTSFCPW